MRTIFRSLQELESSWRTARDREVLVQALSDRGINLVTLAQEARSPESDPLDLLCHIAFNGPLRTRRERAERLKKGHQDFFDFYSAEARDILHEILEKYAEHGPDQLKLPDVLGVPPISRHGNTSEIARVFGGIVHLQQAVDELQRLLYAA